MTRVLWTREALDRFETLNGPEQWALADNLELTRQFPAMYPVRQRGRMAGLRYFVLKRRWLVYYRVSPDEDLMVIFDVVPARARP